MFDGRCEEELWYASAKDMPGLTCIAKTNTNRTQALLHNLTGNNGIFIIIINRTHAVITIGNNDPPIGTVTH